MKYLIAIFVIVHFPAFASRECDWSITVAQNDPGNIASANKQIAFLQSLIDKENETLRKEVYPQLAAWQHTIRVYDGNSQSARQAVLAVNDAILQLKGTMITNIGLRKTFDRLANNAVFKGDQPLSEQLRAAIPKLKASESLKKVLEQWANSVALLEATQPSWIEAEKNIILLLPSSNKALSEMLIDHLQELNNKLASDLQQMADGREQDSKKVAELQSAVEAVQNKINDLQNKMIPIKKQIEYWQNEMANWTPTSRFCPAREPREPRFK